MERYLIQGSQSLMTNTVNLVQTGESLGRVYAEDHCISNAEYFLLVRKSDIEPEEFMKVATLK